jgi:hypothetical protein
MGSGRETDDRDIAISPNLSSFCFGSDMAGGPISSSGGYAVSVVPIVLEPHY